MKKRSIMTIIGLCLLAVGMGMFKTANLGIDPYSGFATELAVFMNEVLQIPGSTYGNVFSGLTALIFIWVFVADRHFIHLGTVIHVLFVGKMVDFIQNMLNRMFVWDTLGKRLLLFLAAFVLFCFASAMYYAADLGVSAYDAISLHMAKKGIMEYRYSRIMTDVICMTGGSILGIIAGGLSSILGTQLGIGTIVTAFGMGPFVQYLRTHIFDKMAE